MKKLLFSLLAVPLLFVGCTPPKHYDKLENKQQKSFDDFLANKRKRSYDQANEIQQKEFYNQFEKDLFHYIDSVKLFINWKGRIKDIKTSESGKSTAISFEIYYQPEEYREISFYCTHIVETDSLGNDYIYNQVKNTSNYSIVYFDGFIRTKNNNQLDYNMRSSGNDLNIAYPNYKFWITDIGTTKRNDNLSINLQNAIDYSYKIIEPLKLEYLNKISKEDSDKRLKELFPEFEILKSKLTKDENQYIQRLITCLVDNFLYGK